MTLHAIPLAGVVGAPVSHSLSPRLHGFWLERMRLPGHYVPLEVSQADLRQTLTAMPLMGFVGCNVTIPHKESVLGLADLVTDRAALIGAANTLIFRPDGKMHADNTDGYGFLQNLHQNVAEWDPAAGPAAIFGAGGASRAVVASLIDAGVPQVRLANRTRARAESLRAEFGPRVTVFDWNDGRAMAEGAATLVNTSSLGMAGRPDLKLPAGSLRAGMVVTDLVYSPLRTGFLRAAEEAGCTIVDGLGMLIWQAVPGFERWFGERPVVNDEVRRAILS